MEIVEPLVQTNPWYISEAEITIRLFLALLFGGMIGFEREHSNHAAGFRTNILVCIGACLLMLLSIYGFSQFVYELNVRVDPARLAAAVITGVGFLGAGTILFTGKKISGLTTAATLWVVAAIGLAVGAGFYFASSIVTLLVITTLWLFNKLEQKYIKNSNEYTIEVNCQDNAGVLMEIQKKLAIYDAYLIKLSIDAAPQFNRHTGDEMTVQHEIRITLELRLKEKKREKMIVPLINDLKQLEAVHWIGYS